jgi:hypothetical protein
MDAAVQPRPPTELELRRETLRERYVPTPRIAPPPSPSPLIYAWCKCLSVLASWIDHPEESYRAASIQEHLLILFFYSYKAHNDLLVTKISNASYSGIPTSTSSFTLFPKLPVELRLRIWRHAISVPQIIEYGKVIVSKRLLLPNGKKGPTKREWCFRTLNPSPLLRACRESRVEALPLYRIRHFNNGCIIIRRIFRADYDIIHLQTLGFIQPDEGFISSVPAQISPGWTGRPANFEKYPGASHPVRSVVEQHWIQTSTHYSAFIPNSQDTSSPLLSVSRKRF